MFQLTEEISDLGKSVEAWFPLVTTVIIFV